MNLVLRFDQKKHELVFCFHKKKIHNLFHSETFLDGCPPLPKEIAKS